MSHSHDLIVIGAGPGGYVAALRAAQLGLKVACIDANASLGGTCLRVGCIPSKCLLESSEHYDFARQQAAEHGVKLGGVELDLPAMMKRKGKIVTILSKGIEGLFKKNGVERVHGLARIAAAGEVVVSQDAGEVTLTAPHVLIATGSQSAPLPGVELDGDRIGTSTEALSYPEVPGHLVVIGAGIIGLELGTVWQRLGARVTVLEYLDRILPGIDTEIAADAQKLFAKQGFTFHLGRKVTRAAVEGDQCVVESEGAEPIACDRVLLAVGRRPHTAGLGLDDLGVAMEAGGRIAVDDHFQTSVPGLYAIGDVIAGPMLAHKAEHEGIACVERLVTGYGHVNYDAVPGVCYTHPEIAAVGRTEEQLTAAGIAYRKGVFPFMANGRARSVGATDGKVKVLADAETDRVLGVHILGPHAGDLIAEAVAAIEYGASSEDMARCFHAHPTLAEALKEAALAVDGRALHV